MTMNHRQVNHRNLLDGMFASCGIKKAKFASVCASVDKLDKQSWTDVRNEIINERRVPAELVEKLEPMIRIRGGGGGVCGCQQLCPMRK